MSTHATGEPVTRVDADEPVVARTTQPRPPAPAVGPTVSVVIPVRDDADHLDACLTLLGRQTRRPDEVVVVDNGSTDASALVARQHGARVVLEPRPGIPAAAAAGYDAARGELILRLDADTRPGPEWVAHAARVLADADVDAVSGVGRFDLRGPGGALLAHAYLGAYYGLGHLAAGHPVLWGSSAAFRADDWRRVRDQVTRSADVHDDLDLALALGPDLRVVVDRTWRVEVSARSLRPGRQWVQRFGRAFRTLRRQWDVMPPWERWEPRLRR
ncbi:glycosyl transferase family 2 [Cellulomonas flavigena DSM 20109]|uniref:4,4'-diaponeurosporenoate glycosyltransferase n=1 Tax=Cellulomonas flavigena (strain ATCC 482 / DSM 20109 / BCRC 11376 / JCM 18109 / NBRC 3775 / NCIMB 8073 / NRS 134) TaxID=446466 RepID=D5UEL4_CELFN|nr:glycosyltransferase family 2 protein [Cellulomonas flavigena]ADG74674.1 glycosyl transferase family 2 [Cellulomonas flavigena DSM 20109]